MRQADAPVPVTIGVNVDIEPTLVWVAQANGYFAEEGLDVTFRPVSSGNFAVNALEAGEVDLATSTEFVVVRKSFANPDLRVLATVSSARTMGLVGRRDRGIADGKDLAGKRIAITAGSIDEFFLSRFLAFNGVDLQGVTLVDLKPADKIARLVDGGVDAAITWQPGLQEMRDRMGAGGVSFDVHQGQELFYVVTTTAGWLAANAKVAEKVLAALVRADRWAAEHPEEVLRMTAKRLDRPEAEVARLWGNYRLAVTLPQSLLVTMEAEARWARNKNLLSGDFVADFSRVVVGAPLHRVRPGAVGIYQ